MFIPSRDNVEANRDLPRVEAWIRGKHILKLVVEDHSEQNRKMSGGLEFCIQYKWSVN